MIQQIFSYIDAALKYVSNSDNPILPIGLDSYHTDYKNGNLVLPKLTPYNGCLPDSIITFTEARARFYGKQVDSKVGVCHYVNDHRFMCAYRNPVKYISMYQSYKATIGADFSLFITMDLSQKLLNTFRNHLLSLIWQYCGINVIPNVSWAEPNSFEYCLAHIPKNSVIAINSMGCVRNYISTYYWEKGYEFVLRTLSPTAILRYGPKMPGEKTSISKYYPNTHLLRMKTTIHASHACQP